MPRQDIGYHVHYTTSGRCFLATEDGEDSAAGPSQRRYLVESSAEASAKRSRRLVTLTKNKTKRPVNHRSQESKKRTRKCSIVQSTYWRFFTSQVFGLTLHVKYCCFVLLFGLLLNKQCLTPAPRAPSAHGAWSGARHHTHAYS